MLYLNIIDFNSFIQFIYIHFNSRPPMVLDRIVDTIKRNSSLPTANYYIRYLPEKDNYAVLIVVCAPGARAVLFAEAIRFNIMSAPTCLLFRTTP